MTRSVGAVLNKSARALAAVLARSDTGVVLEDTLKMALVGKAQAIGNISQLVTLAKGVSGQIDTLIQLPALWSQAGMATKGANQLVAAKTGFLGQFVQGDSG